MQTFLKNLLTVLLYVVLGIAIGEGLFVLQKAFTRELKGEPSAVATPTPSPSSGPRTLVDKATNLSLALPDGYVLEADPGEPSSPFTQRLNVLSKTGEGMYADSGTTVYLVKKQEGSSVPLSTSASRARRSALADYAIDSTYPQETIAGFTHSRYLDGNDDVDVYDRQVGDAYFLVVNDPTDTLIDDAGISQLLSSLTISGETPSESPVAAGSGTSTASSTLLNQSLSNH